MLSIIKLTTKGQVSIESIRQDTKFPLETITYLLKQLKNQAFITLNNGLVEVNTEMRLRMAAVAVELGADIENMSNFLEWQEFEEIAAVALTRNDFFVKKNVRFKQNNKRWEIDVVGYKNPIVICIDCKHWRKSIHYSALRRMVESQVNRVNAFAASLPNPAIDIDCAKWYNVNFVPTILSLLPGSFKFIDNVPIVPVLQLQDFLSQLPAHIGSLKHVKKAFNHL